MAERSIAAVLKTVDCYRSGGSNPSFSAQRDRIALMLSCPFLFSSQTLVIGSALSNERQKYAGCVVPIKNYNEPFEKSGYVKKSQAQHRYYFGGTLSEEQALRDVTVTINDLASKLEDK
jgi:hypothetical protein